MKPAKRSFKILGSTGMENPQSGFLQHYGKLSLRRLVAQYFKNQWAFATIWKVELETLGSAVFENL